jgi:hypothetical protein
MKKALRLRIPALLLALFLLLTACGDKAAETEVTPSPVPSIAAVPPTVATPNPTPEPTPEPTPTPVLYRHPLTGEPLDEPFGNARPYAFMVNNIIYAQPQCGISGADIIYETLAEGGITRMMAVFTDLSDVGAIGSIRSIRSYYVDIAMSYDAIPIHAGGSWQSYIYMDDLGVKDIDGCIADYNAFYRDPNRMAYGVEHSLFTTGEKMLAYLDKNGIRLDHDGEFDYNLQFSDDAAPDGEAAESIVVTFSGGKTTSFQYDASIGLYTAAQYSKDYYDGNTGDTLTFKNVFVLYAGTSTIDDYGRLDVELAGSGEGQFACDGSYTDITWSRADKNSSFAYKTKDGSPLTLGVGTSYVCIIPVGNSVQFS